MVPVVAPVLVSGIHASIQRIVPSVNYLRGSFFVQAHTHIHVHILHSIVTEAGYWLHVVEVGHVLIIVSKFLEMTLVLVLGQESLRPW